MHQAASAATPAGLPVSEHSLAWTQEERTLATELHRVGCGCDEALTWGWLKNARSMLALRRLHNVPVPIPDTNA